jgi:hypothetical protein
MGAVRDRAKWEVPAWIADGSWYANNPSKLQMAISRFYLPVTKRKERDAVAAYAPSAPTFSCSSCGRFAFAAPTVCHWCR